MAIIEMKKLSLIGLKSEQEKILKALHYTNSVQITKTCNLQGAKQEIDEKRYEAAVAKFEKLNAIIDFIEDKIKERTVIAKKEKQDYSPPKKPMFFYRREVSFDEFMLIANDEIELSATIMQVEKHRNRLNANKMEKTRLKNQIEQLAIYQNVDVNFSHIKDTKHVRMFFGVIPQSMKNKLFSYNEPNVLIKDIYDGSSQNVVFAVCHIDEYDKLKSILGDCNFTACAFNFDGNARDKILDYTKQIEILEKEDYEISCSVAEYASKCDSLKLLSDYYLLQLQKFDAEREFQKTNSTFILQAYVPIGFEGSVKSTVYTETSNVLMFFDNPSAEDNVPTLTKNRKLVAPYESVTNLYSAPRATEKDPNLFVGMFFFVFFGLMLSDAGYGVVLTVATLVLMKLFKMESGMKKMILIICMGGVSTIIWGAVFGTWFGADVSSVPILNSVMWFNPLDDPMLMLYICLFLGVLQILFGMGIKGVMLIKNKQIFAALFDIGSWYIFFIGIGILLLGMILSISIMTTIAFIIIGVSLLMIVSTAGRHKKGIIGKVIGGFGGLYNIVNLLSDILSYARLFGLGVATGVIGMTMNLLAGMMFGVWYTIPFGILILIVGHAFNLGINLLGAYIHNCRLQFIEFFGKFYEGGGYDFSPLGSNTRYVKII